VQADPVGTTVWIVNGRAFGRGDRPLVKHLLVCDHTPKVNFNSIAFFHLNWLLFKKTIFEILKNYGDINLRAYFEREKHWKPAEHAWRMSRWSDAFFSKRIEMNAF
jgi:hypothetical protein